MQTVHQYIHSIVLTCIIVYLKDFLLIPLKDRTSSECEEEKNLGNNLSFKGSV